MRPGWEANATRIDHLIEGRAGWLLAGETNPPADNRVINSYIGNLCFGNGQNIPRQHCRNPGHNQRGSGDGEAMEAQDGRRGFRT